MRGKGGVSRRESKAATACPAKGINHWTAAVIIMFTAKYFVRKGSIHDEGNPSS